MTAAKQLEAFMLPGRAERLRQVAAGRTRGLALVLDGAHDPHNLSAALRSADAFGLLEVHVIESQARFRVHRKVSQGAEKWLDIHRWTRPEECSAGLAAAGFDLWLADADPGSRPVDEVPFERRLGLVFGNEHAGASAHMRRAASGTFHIPMHGFAESFNISVAIGIVLAIGVRARQARLGRPGDLSPDEQERLVDDWLRRSVRHADRILERLAAPPPAGGQHAGR